jgi:hypothetical protein
MLNRSLARDEIVLRASTRTSAGPSNSTTCGAVDRPRILGTFCTPETSLSRHTLYSVSSSHWRSGDVRFVR